MNMENFLPGGITICKKEIYSFALHATYAQNCGQTLRHTKHLSAFPLFQVCQIGSMSVRHDQQMAGIHRLNIHEG